MKVLFLAAEVSPIAKVGGLGDFAGELPGFLRDLGVDLLQALPFYPFLKRAGLAIQSVGELAVDTLTGPIEAAIYLSTVGRVPLLLVDAEPLGSTDGIYGDPAEDARKFAHFSVASLLACDRLGWAPDIVHAHDWHTAPAIAWAARNRPGTATILTIHNLPYMGHGGEQAMEQYGLLLPPGSGLPTWAERLPLPLGIASASWITTVSPSYAQEILEPDFGSGLEGFLRNRAQRLTGILNGIDPARWNPAMDTALVQTYGVADLQRRPVNKTRLLDDLGLLAQPSVPLLGMVSRLDSQKGIDIAMEALGMLPGLDWQFVLLGKGDPELEGAARQFADANRDRVRFLPLFDPSLARRVYAGADMILLPSRYEPCGLAQMIAMRYGAVPVAHPVGGLKDTIIDASDSLRGTGFLSTEPRSAAFANAMKRGMATYRDPEAWGALQRRGMLHDFSWKRSASQYVDLYRRAVREPPA